MAQEGPIASPTLVPGSITPVTSDRLLGRDTAGSGVAEQLTVGGGLEFTGSGGIQRSALSGDISASAGSGTTAIGAGKVTSAMLRDSAAVSVIGRSANSTGVPADIAAGSDGDILRRAAGAVGFGTVPVASVTGAASESYADLAASNAAAGAEANANAYTDTTVAAVAWTYVVLGSDFTTNQATAQDTGLKFTPAASKTYIVEASLGLQSNVAGIAPRPGVTWNSGNDTGWARLQWTEGASISFALGTAGIDFGLDPINPIDSTETYQCEVTATIVAGSGASGAFIVTLKSETAGNNVTAKKGSWLRYKTIA